MAVRVVYVLNNKAPDVIAGAEGWLFRDGTLRILTGQLGASRTRTLVEIREDFVLSVEHTELEGDAKEAPEEAHKAPEASSWSPEKAANALKKPRKKAKRAS